MGCFVKIKVGNTVASTAGLLVGDVVGSDEGVCVENNVGCFVEIKVGNTVGSDVYVCAGNPDG